jgi:dTDP-4-amino-4,6-dideoxygalactose transaminase
MIKFNDLTLIHLPLLNDFKLDLEKSVLESDFVLGESVAVFESRLAFSEKVKHVVSVSSGTSALELILRKLNINKDSKIIIPAMTFTATAFAPVNLGAQVVVCDINLSTGNMDPVQLALLINSDVSVVIFVSLHGRLDGLEDIAAICKKYNVVLIVDGAQSQGSYLNNKSIGEYCYAYTLSFYPGKNLGTLGEGGAICTNSESLAIEISQARNWGVSTDRYHSQFWGGNYRLPTLQARFLSTKLNYLGDWVHQRRIIAKEYERNLPQTLLLAEPKHENHHSYHVYSILVEERDKYISEFKKSNIGYSFHYPRAIPEHEYYRSKVLDPLGFPNSKIWAKNQLSLPIYPGLKNNEIEYICEVINSLHGS